MCELSGASIRTGTVVEARDKCGKRIALRSVRDAQNVGRAIAARGMTYNSVMLTRLSALVNVIEEDSFLPSKPNAASIVFAKPERVTGKNRFGIKARFNPGMILDFPKIEIRGPRCTFALRTCLTICLQEMNSKIWTRFVIQAGKNVVSLKDDELERFHLFATEVCKAVNEDVFKLYCSDIAKGFDKVSGDGQVTLHRLGDLQLFAVDCNDSDVGTALRKKYDELTWKPNSERSIKDVELADVVRALSKISMPKEAQDADLADKTSYTAAKDVEIIPFQGSKVVRKASSLFLAYIDENTSFYTGIVDSTRFAEERNNSDDNQDRPLDWFSIGTTAEIAAFIGAEF